MKEPKVTPYGMKQLWFTDPDGYGICFQWSATQETFDPELKPRPSDSERGRCPYDNRIAGRVRSDIPVRIEPLIQCPRKCSKASTSP